MQKKYARLTFEERIEIEKLLSHNKNYSDIATTLNRNKSSIQRDVIKQGRKNYKAMRTESLRLFAHRSGSFSRSI